MRSTTRLGRALDYARAHHDLLPTSALRAEGLTYDQIGELRRDGIIERVIRGLYRLAGTWSPLQDIAAAIDRHGGSVASHVSALYLHGLDVEPPRIPHFTMPPGSTSATRLGVLHRSPLDPVDRSRRQRLAVTTVARSIVDAGEVLSVDELASVVNEAVSRKMVTISQIIEATERVEAAPGRIGSGRLRMVLSTWTDAIVPDSVAEAAAIRRIRNFGLPAPVTQHEVLDEDGNFVARLDMAWPDERIGREYDSIMWHRADRIEEDEVRRQRVEALGWSIEPLYRHHLLPSEVDWLRTLRAELQHEHRSAS